MHIETIKSAKDVVTCVDMYLSLNDESFLPADRDVAIERVMRVARAKYYFRVVRDGGKIVAALVAAPDYNLHSAIRIFKQIYYVGSLGGVKAYRAVQLLHEDMFQFASERGYDVAISQGSPFDPANVFARMLERAGWERKHYLCIKKTPRYAAELAAQTAGAARSGPGLAQAPLFEADQGELMS